MMRISRALPALALALIALAPAARGQESWDVIQIQGKRAGYVHLWVEPVKDKAGRDLMRVRVEWELNLKRGRDPVRLSLTYGTIETPDGQVLRLDNREKAAQEVKRTHGDVVGGTMRLVVEQAGNQQVQEIPWSDDVRGPYAAEMSLSRQKMQPGETRSIKTFVPDLNKVCVTKLAARTMEEIPLGTQGQKRSLLRVEQSVAEQDGKAHPEMDTTLWVDESGQIMKSHMSMLGGVDSYRTTKEGALGNGEAPVFDLLAASIIKCPRIENSDKTRDIVYRVTMEGDEPAQVFPSDGRQTVKAGADKTTATIEVKALGPLAGAPEPAPDASYLQPNPLINSDNARVVAHMKKAVGSEVDPWAKAVAIERYVAKNLSDKNFSTAFAPAAEVAQTMSGDCSEHSVLVAAMCRAAGIPSRCAVGLVYSPPMNGFGPHMWNEVYVNNRWVALDAAFDETEVDATHLRLSSSSLDGVSPFEAFIPVLKVFNKMKIQPVEIR